jgi:hypothetical protein
MSDISAAKEQTPTTPTEGQKLILQQGLDSLDWEGLTYNTVAIVIFFPFKINFYGK